MLVAAIVGCLILVGLFFALLFRSSGDSAVRQVRGGHVTLLAAAKRKALPDLVGATLMPPPRMIRLSALAGKSLESYPLGREEIEDAG